MRFAPAPVSAVLRENYLDTNPEFKLGAPGSRSMAERSLSNEPGPGVNGTPSYIAVLLVEALVVAGLWAFGRYFSG